MPYALRALSPGPGANRARAGPVLAVGADLHRGKFHRQGRRAARRRRVGPGDRGSRHQSARTRSTRRRRKCGLRSRRGFLRRCDKAALVERLPDVFVHYRRAACLRRKALPRRSGSHGHFRSFDGRARRADDCAPKSARLPIGVGVRPDRLGNELSVGQKGTDRLSRCRHGSLARLRRRRAHRRARLGGAGDPRGPGKRRPVHREPAEARAAEGSRRPPGAALELRLHDGYDHSYFFISTFIEDHLRHHARALLAL